LSVHLSLKLAVRASTSQEWLQEFAWTEKGKPAKLRRREMHLGEAAAAANVREPMFCFETALKLEYWATLAYRYKRVRGWPETAPLSGALLQTRVLPSVYDVGGPFVRLGRASVFLPSCLPACRQMILPLPAEAAILGRRVSSPSDGHASICPAA
jgi:hypothetical protein